MSNLPDISELSVFDIAELDIETINALYSHHEEAKKKHDAIVKNIKTALTYKYNAPTAPGTRGYVDGDFKVSISRSKKVTWDQAELANAKEQIEEWGEPVEDYIDVKYSVSEKSYQSWPQSIRKIFDGARTVSCNAPTVKIERTKNGD